MIPNHSQFIEAIAARKKVRISFYSSADTGVVERICAPMDHGPGGGPLDGLNRYWVWNCAGSPPHQTLGLNPQEIVELQVLGEGFQPEDFGPGPWPWLVTRDWSRRPGTSTNH